MKDEIKLVLTTKVDTKIDIKTPNIERLKFLIILILFQVYKARCSTVQITLHQLMCVKIIPLCALLYCALLCCAVLLFTSKELR